MKNFILIVFVFALAGCAQFGESVKTETAKQIIPAQVVQDTVVQRIVLPLRSEQVDSIGRWYLQKYCKGTATVNDNGLRAKIEFFIDSIAVLNNTLNAKKDLAVRMTIDLISKEKIIEALQTTTETSSTPSVLWILFHSWMFTIPAGVLGFLIGLLRKK